MNLLKEANKNPLKWKKPHPLQKMDKKDTSEKALLKGTNKKEKNPGSNVKLAHYAKT